MNILKSILHLPSTIRRLQQRRQQKKASRENIKYLETLAQQHQLLDHLRTAGLLHWDVVQRRLFIEADLAVLFIGDAQRWTAFIHNVYLWLYYTLSQQRTEDYFHQEEIKAVREQMNKGANLSREDIDRIRRRRRVEIMQSEVEAPCEEGFEFFVVRADAVTTKDGTEVGKLVAVGHYEPETQDMEIASWEDVAAMIKTE